MNRKIISRWVNEYLDGEIGLADKAELEARMAANPELRQEYKELRQIGLLLGCVPEITVHPHRFRQRVRAVVDGSERSYFTAQRVFAVAMLVFLLIIGLTFSLFIYQQRMLGARLVPASTRPLLGPTPLRPAYNFTLDTHVSAERFFNRLLVESRLGMAEAGVLQVFAAQTQVFEGAVCQKGGGLNSTTFPQPLPTSLIVSVTPRQARALARLAQQLSGAPAYVRLAGGSSAMDFDSFIADNPSVASIPLYIVFH